MSAYWQWLMNSCRFCLTLGFNLHSRMGTGAIIVMGRQHLPDRTSQTEPTRTAWIPTCMCGVYVHRKLKPLPYWLPLRYAIEYSLARIFCKNNSLYFTELNSSCEILTLSWSLRFGYQKLRMDVSDKIHRDGVEKQHEVCYTQEPQTQSPLRQLVTHSPYLNSKTSPTIISY
jgi:hypothetical protein